MKSGHFKKQQDQDDWDINYSTGIKYLKGPIGIPNLVIALSIW